MNAALGKVLGAIGFRVVPLGQISLMMTASVWPARIDCLAGKVTMGYGLRPGASRSAPGDAVAGCGAG